MGWNVVTVSLRQRIVPDRLLGRLNASYRLVAWGTMPLGAAAGGVLAELFGLRRSSRHRLSSRWALVFFMPELTNAKLERGGGRGQAARSGPRPRR